MSNAVELDGQAMAGVREVDLGDERVATAYPILQQGALQPGTDEKFLHHAAPLAQRNGVVAKASVEGGP